MTSTYTYTQTGIRLRLLSCQLKSVNDRTVRCELLNQIIDQVVADKALSEITIYGVQNGVACAKLALTIDYDEYNRCISVVGDGIPDHIRRRAVDCCEPNSVLTSSNGNDDADCPHWRSAISFFCEMIQEKALTMEWSVRFSRDRAMYCTRYGLVSSSRPDQLGDAPAHMVTNSLFPELTAIFQFSPTMWPER